MNNDLAELERGTRLRPFQQQAIQQRALIGPRRRCRKIANPLLQRRRDDGGLAQIPQLAHALEIRQVQQGIWNLDRICVSAMQRIVGEIELLHHFDREAAIRRNPRVGAGTGEGAAGHRCTRGAIRRHRQADDAKFRQGQQLTRLGRAVAIGVAPDP